MTARLKQFDNSSFVDGGSDEGGGELSYRLLEKNRPDDLGNVASENVLSAEPGLSARSPGRHSEQETCRAVADRMIRLCALLATVALTGGCGDGGSTIAPPPEPPRPMTVAVSPATAEFAALGASVQLTAEVREQNGNVMAGPAVSWSSTAASIAMVDVAGLWIEEDLAKLLGGNFLRVFREVLRPH